MPASIFKVGDRVERIEDRDVTGATILSITELDFGSNVIEIEYDEGTGTGWWPEDSLRPLQ